ncbi:tetratricopeptide repeat-containing sulfotransferase family protein [Xanthomonas campestris]|uniref:tetratricopeptide repeat-containing sulfotransferase family protein n=1 Tax=Xanthomonas campestris TaxID=339 RepID=UPI001E4D8E55|nr:sulfotransferase [Xanthomonas campestris]MCC4606129.1 sulfotransferase [Xanthomonas campestris pv. parthenii]
MSTSATPSYTELLLRADTTAAAKDYAKATALYLEAQRRAPEDAQPRLQLSYVYSLRGEYRLARQQALEARHSTRLTTDQLRELIARLRTFNEIPAMLACIDRLKPLSRIPIPLLISIAAHLTYVNLPQRALTYLDEAKRADPNYPVTLFARGQILTYLGRFSEAQDDLSAGLRRAPEIAQGYWLQSQLRTQSQSSNHIDQIRKQLHKPNRTDRDIALLAFALHKELDDIGDHPNAWKALMMGCRSKRSTLQYSTRQSAALFAELSKYRPQPPNRQTVTPPQTVPIFIVGMHRSGTTLLEQLICASPLVHAAGELYDFTTAMRQVTNHHCKGVIDLEIALRAQSSDIGTAGTHYSNSVQWRLEGQRHFTDKLPSNFLNAGYIAQTLPHAKILHMVRDPAETCFSNLRELFSEANPYSYDMDELADFHDLYRQLMDHWHLQFPGRILDVSYSRLTSDTRAVMQEVATFCDLPFDEGMLRTDASKRPVVTASAVQVRGNVRAALVPKWQAYRNELKPLLDRLT